MFFVQDYLYRQADTPWQISRWRNVEPSSSGAKRYPFEKLYKEFLGELEKMVKEYWSAQLGYKPKRFKKSPKNTSLHT